MLFMDKLDVTDTYGRIKPVVPPHPLLRLLTASAGGELCASAAGLCPPRPQLHRRRREYAPLLTDPLLHSLVIEPLRQSSLPSI